MRSVLSHNDSYAAPDAMGSHISRLFRIFFPCDSVSDSVKIVLVNVHGAASGREVMLNPPSPTPPCRKNVLGILPDSIIGLRPRLRVGSARPTPRLTEPGFLGQFLVRFRGQFLGLGTVGAGIARGSVRCGVP